MYQEHPFLFVFVLQNPGTKNKISRKKLLFLVDFRYVQSIIGQQQQRQQQPAPTPFSQSSTSSPRSQQPKKTSKNHTANHEVSALDQNAEVSQSNNGQQVSAKWHFPKSQEARQETMKARCSKPFGSMHKSRWLTTMVDEERQLIYCQVPKSASSTMKRALVESSGRIPEKMEQETQRMISECFCTARSSAKGNCSAMSCHASQAFYSLAFHWGGGSSVTSIQGAM